MDGGVADRWSSDSVGVGGRLLPAIRLFSRGGCGESEARRPARSITRLLRATGRGETCANPIVER